MKWAEENTPVPSGTVAYWISLQFLRISKLKKLYVTPSGQKCLFFSQFAFVHSMQHNAKFELRNRTSHPLESYGNCNSKFHQKGVQVRIVFLSLKEKIPVDITVSGVYANTSRQPWLLIGPPQTKGYFSTTINLLPSTLLCNHGTTAYPGPSHMMTSSPLNVASFLS